MSDFANIIYEKFFMRDLLGKILPGFIVTITLFSICGIQNFSDLIPFEEIRPILWVIILPWSLLTGLALQILGELLGLHSSSPRPKRLLFFFRPCNKIWRKVNEDFKERFDKLKNASDIEWTKNSKEQRERFVYLKEGSGNLSLSLLFLFVYLISSGEKFFIIPFSLLIFSLFLYWSHLLHATRQARFEIGVLKNSKLLEEKEADEMLKRIRCKLLF